MTSAVIKKLFPPIGGTEMKHNVIKKTMVSLCAFALCAGLTACSENQEKTAEKFLTSVQTQDFATAMSCMDEDNRLNLCSVLWME